MTGVPVAGRRREALFWKEFKVLQLSGEFGLLRDRLKGPNGLQCHIFCA